MKKREFFKRLLGVGVAAVVAPEVLLAEEKRSKPVVSGTIMQQSIGLFEPSSVTVFGDGNGKMIKAYVSDIEFFYEEYDAKKALLNQKKYPRKRGK